MRDLRRLPELLQPTQHERDHKPPKRLTHEQYQRKQGEEPESGQDERFLGESVGSGGNRDIDQYRRHHLDRREHPELNSGHGRLDRLHCPHHDEGVGNLLTEANQDVGHQQVTHRRTHPAHQRPRMKWREGRGTRGGSAGIIRCWNNNAIAANTNAATNAARTPSLSPHTAMKTPPSNGPSAMGTRRTRECMVTPMVRFPAGSIR